jgi:hypothetical protein
MPSIPNYNQGATEEAGLTRAKKRIITLMEQGILKLTDKPAVDPTNGKADSLGETVVKQMEEITSILIQGNLVFIEGDNEIFVENIDDARKVLRNVVIARKLMRRLLRETKSLSKGIGYVDLGLYSDIQTAWKELSSVYSVAYTYLTNIDLGEVDNQIFGDVDDEYGDDGDDVGDDISELSRDTQSSQSVSSTKSKKRITKEAFGKIANFEDLVLALDRVYQRVDDLMTQITTNFNQARQQRVLPREAIAEENTQSISGGMFRKPIYQVGNNSMRSLYELDGLPRYI